MMKRAMAFFMAICMAFSLAGCGETKTAELPTKSVKPETDTEWAVYWYLCGSDLESEYGAATADLEEMMEVELPPNVKIVIQTGGASQWQNDTIDASKLQRYVYDADGLNLIEEQPSANMGDGNTLQEFLSFAYKNYPAKHIAVTLWNHGGGSVSGASFDELYEMSSLDLNEMNTAFKGVFGESSKDPPVDIVGFDTCLMATVDVAGTFANIGKYLVASEEVEPGNGWLYSGWLGEIAKNPQIEPLELSKAICDTYVDGCKANGTEDNITLSVIDLTQASALLEAYEEFGKAALRSATEDPAFFTHFSKIANSAENYGGNTREQGYTNMADLGDLAKGSNKLVPTEAGNVISALESCVAYKVQGKYRQNSTGVACYYSYNGDLEDLSAYIDIGTGTAFKYFYAYGLTGELSAEGMKYVSDMNVETLQPLLTINNVNWNEMPVTVDNEGCATIDLGADAYNTLASIGFQLYYVDAEEDIMLCLGTDNDIISDWEKGVFKDNFRGVWGSLDGALCYMEISYEGDDYNIYSIPILLNGKDYNLSVVYDFTSEEYYIEGARKCIDESGAADKNLRYLQVGDEIQTVHYAAAISSESDELTAVNVDKIIVKEDTAFAETDLGDGTFIMIYEMKDSQGNAAYSAPITFEYKNGEITTSVE